jgi:hypothetical protein
MKRIAVSLLLLFALALAADELRAAVEGYIFFRIDPQLAGSTPLLLIQAVIYVLIFIIAGVMAGIRFRSVLSAIVAGFVIGLLVLAPAYIQGDISPIHYSTHGPGWLNSLGWVNWFGPPVGGAIGAALLAVVNKNRSQQSANAA